MARVGVVVVGEIDLDVILRAGVPTGIARETDAANR